MQYAHFGVAAHRDLNPGLKPTLAMHRQMARERALLQAEASARNPDAPAGEPVAEMRDRPGAERDVDERIQLEEALALRLGIAAADGDHLLGITLLQRPRLSEMRGEALIGLLADRARIEDEDVGFVLGMASPRPSSSSMPLMRSESCAFIWQPKVVTW